MFILKNVETMRKIHLFILLILIQVYTNCYAEEKPIIDSTCKIEYDFRNKVGFNIAPAAGFLLNGSEGQFSVFALHYWRRLTKHYAFHLSPKFILTNNSVKNDSMLATSDTSYISVHSTRYENNKVQLNAGLQYSWGTGTLSYFAGLDLFYAQNKAKKLEEYNYYKLVDKGDGMIYYYQGNSIDGINFRVAPRFNRKTLNEYLGLTLGGGLKITFSKRISIIAQSGIDISYVKTQNEEFRNGIKTKQFTNYFFDASWNTPISDVSVCFKF